MKIGLVEGHRELRQRIVVNLSEPRSIGYGWFDAVFEDGCGNPCNLQQDSPTGGGA
jgi:hypothetical protein